MGVRRKKNVKKTWERYCKWCKQKDGSSWLHNAIDFKGYNLDLTPVWQKDCQNRKGAFAQCIEVKDLYWKRTKQFLCSLKKGREAPSDSNSNWWCGHKEQSCNKNVYNYTCRESLRWCLMVLPYINEYKVLCHAICIFWKSGWIKIHWQSLQSKVAREPRIAVVCSSSHNSDKSDVTHAKKISWVCIFAMSDFIPSLQQL